MAILDRVQASEGFETRRAGEVFGRYEILFPIASGGMATVYAARVRGEGRFQKPVAIKLMLPHLTRDERFSTMFMDEATLAAHIESPHVVGTLDLGREGDTLYMVMDLVIGPTLRELLSPGRLPAPMTAAVIVQTARGLHDAHQARSAAGEPLRLVHRDVSPHNVLVGVDGRARLSDFGVARAIHRQSHTETGELKGKLAYFSPEQLEARDDLDHRSDIFALGIVAWEAFTGERLFAAPNPLALAKLIANLEIPRLDERAGLPTPVADVIARALQRDAGRRFQTADDMANALEQAARGSIGLASASELGATVRAQGGARIRDLERRIQRLMSEDSFEVTPPVVVTEELEVTVSERNAGGHGARTLRRVAVALAGIVAVGVGVTWGWGAMEPAESPPPPATVERAEPPGPPNELDLEPAPPHELLAVSPLDREPDDVEEGEVGDGAAPPRPRSRVRAGAPRTRASTRSERATTEMSVVTPAQRAPDARLEPTSMSVLRVGLERFERSLQNAE